MNRIQLSKNFYLDEFTRSQTATRHGIDIVVPENGEIFHNLKNLCDIVLQPLRDNLGPVHISSGYRPPKLNKLIGGSETSEHCFGRAADFVVSGFTPFEVALWIERNVDGYNQLIHEFGKWVHASVPALNALAKMKELTAVKVPAAFIGKPRTVYVPGIIPLSEAKRRVT